MKDKPYLSVEGVVYFVFVLVPFTLVVMIPLFLVGATAGVIWDLLCTGFLMGQKWLERAADEVEKWQP